MRQELGDRNPEEHGVQQAQGHRHDACGDGDPQGAEYGAAVTLLDVLPTELKPQLMLEKSTHEIGPRCRECGRPGVALAGVLGADQPRYVPGQVFG